MPLTPQQIAQLNAANQRIATGVGSDTDRRNVQYATERQGYRAPVQGGPVGSVPVQGAPSDPLEQKRNARAQFQSQGYSYLSTMDEVQNAVRQYGQGRVKNIAGDYFVIPEGIGAPSPNGSIPAGGLGSNPHADLSRMLGANIGPDTVNSDLAGLFALYGKDSEGQQEYDALQKQLIETQQSIGGMSADVQAEFEKQGVNQAYQQVKELTLRAAQLQGEMGKFDAETEALKANIENQPIPTGLIQGQAASLQKQRDLTRLSKAADLSATIALTQAYQGNAQLGMQLAQTAVDLKYQPILNSIDVLKTQIGFAGEKLSKADRNRFAVIDQLIGIKQKEIEEEKATKSQVESIAIEAATYGAPLALVNSIREASNPADAARIASSYLGVNVEFQRSKEMASFNKSLSDSGKEKQTPTSGFLNAEVESSVRDNAVKLLDEDGKTPDEAYKVLRRLYSTNEASDSALKQLVGLSESPSPGQMYDQPAGPVNPNTNFQKLTASSKKFFANSPLGFQNIKNSISNFLFGGK